MFWFRRKKPKPWRNYYRLEWYSTGELQQFLQVELDAISWRSAPVWQHIERAAKLEAEIARRTSTTNPKNL
jgi:hypothetical protein